MACQVWRELGLEQFWVESAGDSNSGNLFRFHASTGQCIFNPSTRVYQGTYLIRVTLDDGTAHEVRISVR